MVDNGVQMYVLGDTSTQILCRLIRNEFNALPWLLELIEGDYNQINQEIFNNSSNLYKHNPAFVILFKSTHHLQKSYALTSFSEKENFAIHQVELIDQLANELIIRLGCKVILCNYYSLPEPSFGNFANKMDKSFSFQLRKLNLEIMHLSQRMGDVHVCDLQAIVTNKGIESSIDNRMLVLADMPLTATIQRELARNICLMVKSMKGLFAKCLVLDLDNVLWGGEVGDLGWENIQLGDKGAGKAFSNFQTWVKMMKERGVILAVCSKNTDELAREPFLKHPDMVLSLDDIAVFVANWESKASNILKIQEILNIGSDSMVFIDDNPFERSQVKNAIPEIIVPEMPDDPAEYGYFLSTQNLFEVASFSDNDLARSNQYKAEIQREEYKQSCVNEQDYLLSLTMSSTVAPFNTFTIPRVSQLTQRSNQFNLRTIRYSESQIQQITLSENHFTFCFTLQDKYGDHGFISMVILERQGESLFIDTWIMSCRVLKRTMEAFVLNILIKFARENNFSFLKGEYIQTSKNGIVVNHYNELGFVFDGKYWKLDLETATEKLTYITHEHDHRANL